MTSIGTPLSASATRVLLLGSGELGKEVAIELHRLGCEVIACDRYENAPAMQVAHRSHVFSMQDGEALRRVIAEEQPQLVVPEIEAIATDVLLELESAGHRIIPTARATNLTMNREGIRRLAAEELGLPTSPYRFVGTLAETQEAVAAVGCPCVIKPLMSSSGHGQSVIKNPDDIATCWQAAQDGARGSADNRCIIEGFVAFDYEITCLTVSAVDGIRCCPPVGHIQVDGDYRESWQPAAMSDSAWVEAQRIAQTVVQNLGGYGLFGVELFVCGDQVLFSEVSPRPHDTGLVTLASQTLSEFALHARAILGLPVGEIRQTSPSASCAILGEGDGVPRFDNLETALAQPECQIRLFGKPVCAGHRRLAVAVASADDINQARKRARTCANAISISLD